ncbi:hypothetical protein HDU67_009468 [Dinochytrium kinnereticum]|nr:hypothetical protein HDU67_009468 [Dinochytrium kinnereticum]
MTLPSLSDYNPLLIAVRAQQMAIVKELLECGANPVLHSHVALEHAIRGGFVKIAVEIASFPYQSRLDNKAKPSFNISGLMETAVIFAIEHCQSSILDALLEKYRDALQEALDGVIDLSHCLIRAVKQGDETSVRKLLRAGANILSRNGLESISAACYSKKLQLCQDLVSEFEFRLKESGKSSNDWAVSCLPSSRSVQIMAQSYLRSAVGVRYILEIPLDDEEMINTYGPTSTAVRSAADLAAFVGDGKILGDLLVDPRAGREHALSLSFLNSVVHGGKDTVNALLDSNVLQIERPDGGRGENYDILEHMLHSACLIPSLEVASILMSRGVRFSGTLAISEPSPTNKSIFWKACRECKLELAAALLEGRVYSPNENEDAPDFNFSGHVVDSTLRKLAPQFSMQVLGMFPAESTSVGVWRAFEALLQAIRDSESGDRIPLAMLNRSTAASIVSSKAYVATSGEAVRLFIRDAMNTFAPGHRHKAMLASPHETTHNAIVTCTAAAVAVIRTKRLEFV